MFPPRPFLPLLSLLLALGPCPGPSVRAQTSNILTVEPATVTKEIVVDQLDEDYEDVTAVTVANNSRRTIELAPELVVPKRPRTWKYSFFNRRQRTTPYVNASDAGTTTVRLLPGESTVFYLVLAPDGLDGAGRAELRFTDLSVGGTTLATASFATRLARRAPPPAATEGRPTPTRISVFPNPATEKFFVETPPGQRVGRVEISNTLGRRMRRFDGPPGREGYDIESLPDGLYLISIYDEDGNKLRTLRLLHRKFGA